MTSRELEPIYTHALHFQASYDAAQKFQVPGPTRVLAKRGLIVYCAIIKHAYTVPNGPDCWTVETSWPEKTRITVPCKNVIACDVQFCSCEADAARLDGGEV